MLGSYSDLGRDRLARVCATLNGNELEGVVVGDFADSHQQSLFEKVLMFGSLSRFIICDESVAAVAWARRKVDERSELYNQQYLWRNKNVSLG